MPTAPLPRPTSMRAIRSLLCATLAVPLAGQRELLEGLPAATTCTLPNVLCGGDEVRLAAPVDDTPHGLAFTGKVLWLACGDQLWRLGWPDLAVQSHVDAPPGILDLCADARSVYALRADDLLVLDAISGRPVHTVALDVQAMRESIEGTGRSPVPLRLLGIGVHGGKVHVIGSGRLFCVDRLTGRFDYLGNYGSERGIDAHWLTHDGSDWIIGGESNISRTFDTDNPPAAAARWSAEWGSKVTASAATWVDGELLVFARAPGPDGFPSTTARRFVPRLGGPPALVRVGSTGQDWWQSGNQRGGNMDKLQRELQQQFSLAAALVKATGDVRPPQLVLVPLPDTPVGAIGRARDRAIAAGFTDVRCPGLAAWVAARAENAAEPGK